MSSKLLALGLSLLIFAGGFACGWVVQQSIGLSASTQASKPTRRKRRRGWRKRFIKRLTKRLSLDAKQVDKIQSILDTHGRQYRQIRDSIRPALGKVRQEMRKDILAVLKATQAKEFQRMIAEFKKRREARRKRRRQRRQRRKNKP